MNTLTRVPCRSDADEHRKHHLVLHPVRHLARSPNTTTHHPRPPKDLVALPRPSMTTAHPLRPS